MFGQGEAMAAGSNGQTGSRSKWFGFIIAWMASAPLPSAAANIDAEDLRSGLVATYRDAGNKPVVITQFEPTIALALGKSEAPHPRLRADGGTIHWQGYLNILRPGTYRFDVRLRGRLRVTIAGKEVLATESQTDSAALEIGSPVKMEAGIHALTAKFTRFPGVARVELFWEAAHFSREPLPPDVLTHLPARVPEGLHQSARLEQGRYLVEEHNCSACHRPADQDALARGLQNRQGPDLSRIGERAYAGWLYQWLESPDQFRPGTPMPKMFNDDEAGQTERYAVTRYLVSLGGPLKATARPIHPNELRVRRQRGRRLFTSVGCMACHQSETTKPDAALSGRPFNGARRNYPLVELGSQTSPDKLASYLENPLAVDPSGRMPHMLLQHEEARDLAFFLCTQGTETKPAELSEAPSKARMAAAFKMINPRPEELAAFLRLGPDAQWQDLGKRLVIDKGCNNCHNIAPGGKGFATMLASASFEDLKVPQAQKRGCLTPRGKAGGKAPRFHLGDKQMDMVRKFLREGSRGAGSPAPTYAARVALERFNCLACHNRDGMGGLSTKLIEQLRRFENAENAEAVVPPPLTGVGHKLRTPWMREVLTRAARARPWMGLRMPQFGEANVGKLPEALAALEGADVQHRGDKVPLTAAKIEAGRQLVGKQVFGCITCHDIAGIPNTGTRGPDLALTSQRVRYDWFRRWLEQAQRMQPGTRMPTVFPDGKSTNESILGGKADAQAEAIWAYLSLGPTLQLPEGMEPPRGLVLTVNHRPVLLRTFMPDAGNRAVAVGYPGGVATVFDARRCRLAYGWSGNFLDASPVWNDRGGAPAKVLGARFWTSPPGCPWAVNDSNEPPDFAQQARDPAYGANPEEGKLFKGRRALSFEGYHLDRAGQPTFRYCIDDDSRHALQVAEKPVPLRSPAGVGLARQFTLNLAAQKKSWLLAGETGHEPRLLDSKANPISVDWKNGKVDVAAVGRILVLPQHDGKVIVLVPTRVPQQTRWLVRKQNGTWKTILELPLVKDSTRTDLRLHVWAPYRDEPGLLKELISAK
jgi:mono/diheme cytochrome c family protein